MGNLEVKSPFQTLLRIWEGIKMEQKGIGHEDTEWILLANHIGQWLFLINAIM
jgi:hypothetical protein